MLIHDALQLRQEPENTYQPETAAPAPAVPMEAPPTEASPVAPADPYPVDLPQESVFLPAATTSVPPPEAAIAHQAVVQQAAPAIRPANAPSALVPTVAAGIVGGGLAMAPSEGVAEPVGAVMGPRWKKDALAIGGGCAAGGLLIPALWPKWFEDPETGERDNVKVASSAALAAVLAFVCSRAFL